MSGPQRPGVAPDELGLAEVAWRLRTTLAEAGDVSVGGNDTVLSTIRRRSTQRRRAKRVMGTSVAAFALSVCTLVVVKGGQVAIDHNRAGNNESPAVTLGAQGPDDETPVSDVTTDATDSHSSVIETGTCRDGEPQTCTTTTQPSSETSAPACVGPSPCTTTARGNDPTSSAPGGPAGPTNTGPVPTTPLTTAPTLPPTTPKPPTAPLVNCGAIRTTQTPADPQCFQRAYLAGRGVVMDLEYIDPDTGATVRWGVKFEPGFPLTRTPIPDARPVQQCPQSRYVGAPTWYDFGTCLTL